MIYIIIIIFIINIIIIIIILNLGNLTMYMKHYNVRVESIKFQNTRVG